MKFEILNPKIAKFEILNPNTKISNLDTKFLNFDDFCYKFEENFAECLLSGMRAASRSWCRFGGARCYEDSDARVGMVQVV